jgi:hypothetical protein
VVRRLMNDKAMMLRGEDPGLYRCGDEREPYARTMRCDESDITVVGYRIAGSVESDSLSWRFIRADRRTLVVRPVQLRFCERPLCVPDRIESSSRSARNLARWVHGLISPRYSPSRYPDFKTIREETHFRRQELNKRWAKGSQPTKKEREQAWEACHEQDPKAREERVARHKKEREQYYRNVSLYEINKFMGQHTGKKPMAVPDPGKNGYTREQGEAIIKRLTDANDAGAAKLGGQDAYQDRHQV